MLIVVYVISNGGVDLLIFIPLILVFAELCFNKVVFFRNQYLVPLALFLILSLFTLPFEWLILLEIPVGIIVGFVSLELGRIIRTGSFHPNELEIKLI